MSPVVLFRTLTDRRPFGPTRSVRLEAIASRAAAWIDRYPARAFLLLTIAYAGTVVALSSMKLLWLDEMITLHIARLGSASAIWNALAQGADPNPPLTHLLVLGSMRVFGDHALSLRLPAAIGYWVGMLALFLFLRRRLPATWALAGVVMSMAMAAFQYSYESRSYGIFYGLAMLAVYCWSRAVDPILSPARRRLALAGMALALAAGISTSYIAVLAFLPIAGGEIARTIQALRSDRWQGRSPVKAFEPWIWIALATAALPLLIFLPLMQRSIAEFAPYAWNKVSIDQAFDSYTEMVEMALYPILALLLFTGIVFALSHFCSHCRQTMRPDWVGRLATQQARFGRATLPPHEAVAVLLLMSYPILGYIVASLHGGMLSPRFVIPVCFGFAIAGTLAGFRIFGHFRAAGLVLLAISATWFAARESVIGYWYMEQKQCFYKVLDTMPKAAYPGEPIAIPDPLLALTFRRYAPPEVAARVVFPVDFPAIRLYRGEDSPEENLWAGRGKIYRMPIVPLASFQRSAGKYLMIASDGDWMVQDLMAHRYPVERLPINTRAGAIGGFTPLARGTPVFYTSVGDRFLKTTPGFLLAAIPFRRAKNLPGAKLTPSEGGPFEDAK